MRCILFFPSDHDLRRQNVARNATVIALAGIYFGIFALMLAASWGQSYWNAAVGIWAVGWVFIAWAFREAQRTD